ncbi:MAG: hypothetical protein KGM97_02970 [Alphaproteobacteria bacterium]|nr:hypothetical protein [Alphaproteobacteria bacterium]MDE2629933.1 hypothetical protein [Alphaproteobacteria bacterium]
MRMARSEGMGWGGWVAIALGALTLIGAAGLAIYGGTVHPKVHEIRQVLSNDRFPT